MTNLQDLSIGKKYYFLDKVIFITKIEPSERYGTLITFNDSSSPISLDEIDDLMTEV